MGEGKASRSFVDAIDNKSALISWVARRDPLAPIVIRHVHRTTRAAEDRRTTYASHAHPRIHNPTGTDSSADWRPTELKRTACGHSHRIPGGIPNAT